MKKKTNFFQFEYFNLKIIDSSLKEYSRFFLYTKNILKFLVFFCFLYEKRKKIEIKI